MSFLSPSSYRGRGGVAPSYFKGQTTTGSGVLISQDKTPEQIQDEESASKDVRRMFTQPAGKRAAQVLIGGQGILEPAVTARKTLYGY